MRGGIVELEYAGGSWYIDEKPLDGEVNHIGQANNVNEARKIAVDWMRNHP